MVSHAEVCHFRLRSGSTFAGDRLSALIVFGYDMITRAPHFPGVNAGSNSAGDAIQINN